MKKIFITGHKGMVGSAMLNKLKNSNLKIVTADKKKINLLNQKSVLNFMKYIYVQLKLEEYMQIILI